MLQLALIASLETELQGYDRNCKNKTLEQKRRERLAFVGISIGNIIFDEKGEVSEMKKSLSMLTKQGSDFAYQPS